MDCFGLFFFIKLIQCSKSNVNWLRLAKRQKKKKVCLTFPNTGVALADVGLQQKRKQALDAIFYFNHSSLKRVHKMIYTPN